MRHQLCHCGRWAAATPIVLDRADLSAGLPRPHPSGSRPWVRWGSITRPPRPHMSANDLDRSQVRSRQYGSVRTRQRWASRRACTDVAFRTGCTSSSRLRRVAVDRSGRVVRCCRLGPRCSPRRGSRSAGRVRGRPPGGDRLQAGRSGARAWRRPSGRRAARWSRISTQESLPLQRSADSALVAAAKIADFAANIAVQFSSPLGKSPVFTGLL
jgi:hypothetical protein